MQTDLLDRARSGDEQAFAELTAGYRRELHVHCYRMLGSFTDAEDLLQETLLAAWQGLPRYEQRASLRSWLYRIATNRCLNALRSGRRRPPEPTPPFDPPEPTSRDALTWLQPYPDALLDEITDPAPGPEARYESHAAIELAFITALQHLPPRQTAALVLRDVLGYSTNEVAAMLDTTPTAVKGALQRARNTLAQHKPEMHGGIDRSADAEIARRFADAYAAADIDAAVELLTDDAWLTMPPAPHRYDGIAAIREFWSAALAYRARDRIRIILLPTQANNLPALAAYQAGVDDEFASPAGIFVLTPSRGQIGAVTRFHTPPDLYPHFGLPLRVRAAT
ncbi:sigma-70 family RNA polymerase sigma factor [Skermania sp. ID1734]|uniref:RNA polymerase subunit sigma-70 n=1 Tax=Skermania sp. ID1734 TaxID=2597516 RepID=UPI0011803610|nr:RNA polymerase subunit sigma-70 [Skermania sp. ID1734]TSD99480.1 sigma-70 family RNA polymerase sigma factor [Skermania sp. ID1734]